MIIRIKPKKILKWVVYLFPFIVLGSVYLHINISEHINIQNEKISKSYIDQMVLPSDKDCDIALIENRISSLYKLNPKISKKLLDKGLKIKFLKDKNSTDFLIDKQFDAYYTHDKKTITYSTINNDGPYLPMLQFHELGHAIDDLLLNNVSKTIEFNNIFSEEATNILGNTHYLSSSSEYFAEAFAMYSLKKESGSNIKNKAPKTYEYMDKLVKKLILND